MTRTGRAKCNENMNITVSFCIHPEFNSIKQTTLNKQKSTRKNSFYK